MTTGVSASLQEITLEVVMVVVAVVVFVFVVVVVELTNDGELIRSNDGVSVSMFVS